VNVVITICVLMGDSLYFYDNIQLSLFFFKIVQLFSLTLTIHDFKTLH